jgi:hypothetical protein
LNGGVANGSDETEEKTPIDRPIDISLKRSKRLAGAF